MSQSFLLSQVYAFLTVLLWSSAYVFTKIALQSFSALSLGLLRCAVATGVLILISLIRKEKIIRIKDIPFFVVSGVAGFSLYLLTFNIGSLTTNPTTSCIIISLSPIITALFSIAAFNEKINFSQWISIILAFGGILVMTLWGGSFSISKGILWMLAAAFLISIYNVLQRWLSHSFTPIQITTYSFFFGTIMLLWHSGAAVDQVQAAPASQIALVCFLGIFPSAIAYLFWGKALTVAKNTSSVTNYMFLTPFLSLMLEYLVIGSLPGMGTYIGGGIILVSLCLFTVCKNKSF